MNRPAWTIAAPLLAILLLAGACSTACDATPEKLATLRRGMSSAEATTVLGCRGQPVPPTRPGDAYSSLAWQGPGGVAMETQLDFEGDRLLYYVTVPRGAL